MKSDKLLNAIGQIDDEIILDTEVQKAKKPFFKTKGFLIPMAAACLVLAITAAFVFAPPSDTSLVTPKAYALEKAQYPERVQYPSDFDDFSAFERYSESENQRKDSYKKIDSLDSFVEKTSMQFLKNSGEENVAYSPVNVYFALSMLSEICDGESREQVLSLLGSENIAEQRENVYSLWNSHYRNDGTLKSVFANSLWTRNDMQYKAKTVKTLATEHFASSFSGEMGTDGYNAALQNWINEQTGGLFENNLNDVKMNEDTVFALASAANFSAKWDFEFKKENTQTKTFYAKGGEEQAEFLTKNTVGEVFIGNSFMAYKQKFAGGGGMWLILPDEDVEASDLAGKSELYEFIAKNGSSAKRKEAIIDLAVPKFDVSSQFDLKGGLKALGIKDVFDYKKSDFSPLTDERDDLYVSSALHGARVKIDEEGCVAAAYTVIMVESTGALLTDNEINFTLDRPFLFAVTSDLGVPLFIGVINTVK